MSAAEVSPTAEEHDEPTTAESTETMMQRDGYMEPKDAAIDIGCGERWLRDGANKHGFPHYRLGKSLWFSPENRREIREWHRQPARFRSKATPRAKKSATSSRTQAKARNKTPDTSTTHDEALNPAA